MNKLENTLENKWMFFAQYWSQEISYVRIDDAPDRGPFVVDLSDWRVRFNDSYLFLKPLTSITDEDAVELVKLFRDKRLFSHVNRTKIYSEFFFKKSEIEELSGCIINRRIYKDFSFDDFTTQNLAPKDFLNIYQYLHSKGYALPWMDLSVEDLIEYGWIKIKN
jgi:hypothetical protein